MSCTVHTESGVGRKGQQNPFSFATDSKIRGKANGQSRQPKSNGCGPLK